MSDRRIVKLDLDEHTVLRRNPDIEHERAIAIFDLLEENSFSLLDAEGKDVPGPFHLILGIEDNRLVFDIRRESGEGLDRLLLSLAPFRGIVKDYFLVCESYFDAIKRASPTQIEAIDMGRRGLHNEGSELLRDELKDKVLLDLDTARRLFTLLCVLHIRG